MVDAKYFYNPGLAIVKKKTVWGLVDTPGNFKVNCIYDDIDYNLEELDDATLDFKSRFGNKPIDFWTTSS
ncbi:MAG: WG repeat-containing protein [Bacteroidota bacterium]